METTWGVGTVTQSLNALTNVPVWNAGDLGQTLGFVLYGIADKSVSGVSPNVNIQNTGATTSPFGAGNGKINIDIYTFTTINTPCFSAGCGNEIVPGDRLANSGGLAVVDGVTTGAGSGTLFMHIEMIPGINPLDSDVTLSQTATGATLPASGVGSFYANCISGDGCSEFKTGSFGAVLATFFGIFDLHDNTTSLDPSEQARAAAGWPGSDSDPILAFSAVPEPASLALLGSALAFFGVAVRRRRKGMSA